MFEFIVEVLLVGTGTALRWFLFQRGQSLSSAKETGDLYWTDLILGLMIWTSVGSGIYYFL